MRACTFRLAAGMSPQQTEVFGPVILTDALWHGCQRRPRPVSFFMRHARPARHFTQGQSSSWSWSGWVLLDLRLRRHRIWGQSVAEPPLDRSRHSLNIVKDYSSEYHLYSRCLVEEISNKKKGDMILSYTDGDVDVLVWVLLKTGRNHKGSVRLQANAWATYCLAAHGGSIEARTAADQLSQYQRVRVL